MTEKLPRTASGKVAKSVLGLRRTELEVRKIAEEGRELAVVAELDRCA
jgi:hypothetical protein